MSWHDSVPRLYIAVAVGLAICGCEVPEPGAPACSPAHERCDPIPADAFPCMDQHYWPLNVRSSVYPLAVHYSSAAQKDMALIVLEHLEAAWVAEIDGLGFAPLLPDEGLCGPDESYDVFLWQGQETVYVDGIAPNPATPHNDWFTYMVVDPWGKYGGEYLFGTIAHEFNHSLQASDDWWENPALMEMTATFVEALVAGQVQDWPIIVKDFQDHPDWSLDHYDEYQTWYMYGSSVYLRFLHQTYFAGDARFIAEAWRKSRSPEGADTDPLRNEPDLMDALDQVLQAGPGVSFLDSVVAFAPWRNTLSELPRAQLPAQPASTPMEPAPMMLGIAPVEITRAPDDPESMRVSVDSPANDITWAVQVNGQRIPLQNNAALVELGAQERHMLILTALPAAPYDPDERTDARYPVTLILDPAP